jgi:hypothetical protein
MPTQRNRDHKERASGNGNDLPPHSTQAERAALGCILLAAGMGGSVTHASMSEVDALIGQLAPRLFYDNRNLLIFRGIVSLRQDNHSVDTVTLIQWLSAQNEIEKVGGFAGVASLPEETPSQFNFGEYLRILRDKAHRRWMIAKSVELQGLAGAETVTLEDTRARLSEIFDASTRASQTRGDLKIWRFDQLMEYNAPMHLALVGDNEVRMGYEGVTLLAGPGSSGKSLAVSSLALAGALGHGLWMGRRVHRQFRTLIIQAENGATRLKKELETIAKNHPDADLQEWVMVSDPPEGGIPFHRPEFRASVRRLVEQLKPDLVVLDPWSHVAVEDAAKEVVDKIAEIRSCFPAGDQCPGLLIVAHTKKPRAEDVKKGRSLGYSVSGSVALLNTARCCYMLLPWSDDLEDDRIYWACVKLNDGSMYPASVWRRRFGTFFDHDPRTDPTTWGDEPDRGDRRTITEEMIADVFRQQKRPGMKRGELVKFLVEYNPDEVSESTAWRALSKSGYAKSWITEAAGVISPKKHK